MKLQGGKLSALQAYDLATLGSTRALSLADKVGSLKVGDEADFVVLDPVSTPRLKFRM